MPSHDVAQATAHVRIKDSDRRWLQGGLALVVGAFVAAPALPETTGRANLVFLLVAGTALALLLQRGVPVTSRTRSTSLLASGIAGALLALSTSFGLVAADAHLWVAVPALAAAALTLALARLADRPHPHGRTVTSAPSTGQ